MCTGHETSVGLKCVRTSRTESFRNLSPLEIVVSRNVVSVSDTSTGNFIVGWWLLACSVNCDICTLICLWSRVKICRLGSHAGMSTPCILRRWISSKLFLLGTVSRFGTNCSLQ